MIRLIIGIAAFFTGVRLMVSGLKAWGYYARFFRRVAKSSKSTASAAGGMVVGALVTAFVQSSSAVSVFLVGLGDAGFVDLRTALAFIIGANIGTCITSQVAAIRVGSSSRHIAVIGGLLVILGLLGRKRRMRAALNFGRVLLGVGLMYMGMQYMESGAMGLAGRQLGKIIFEWSERSEISAFVAGCVATAAIQSSSAIVAMSMAVARSGALSVERLIGVILGANVGTCFAALIAATGRSRRALQVAVGHLVFNVLGSILFLPFSGMMANWLPYVREDLGGQVAHAHLAFNVITAALSIPLFGSFVRLIELICPEKPSARGNEYST